MGNDQGYPRRKQPRARRLRESERQGSSPTEPASGVATRGAFDVAAYVSDITAQLEAMAQAANLELLAYFLGMARSEADLFMRTNAGPGDDSEGAGNQLADEGQAEFDGPDD